MRFLTFYRVAVSTSILFFLLASVLMFEAELMLTSWGITFTESLGVLARRIAAVYAGISVMLFFARNTEHSPARTAIIYGVITFCLLLVALGAYEFSVGNLTSDIISSILIEIAVVVAFACVGCSSNNKS